MASIQIRIGLRLQLEKKWQIIWCQIQVVHWCFGASSHRNHHHIPIQGHLSQFSNAHCTGLQMTEKFSETKSLQRLVYLASQLIQVHLDFSFFLQRTLFQRIYAIFREIVNIV